MNSFLLNRQLGSISPLSLVQAQNTRLLQSLQLVNDAHFIWHDESGVRRPGTSHAIAHGAGVSSIVIDRFEGRYLVSGGADSSLAVWDLEEPFSCDEDNGILYKPVGKVARTSITESLGITHVSFYPFDSLALLTSGYDRTLKLVSSESLKTSATFDLGSIVYSHTTSTIASHLLVACATQHPAVRLVDLRSGANTHSLAGHAGSVMSVAWHPKEENILASAATDGVVRLWDIRRSAASLGVLDAEDSIGIAGYDGKGTGARKRERGKSHRGAANGVLWTEDGQYIVSVGHDERMRVWNMTTGANTLANFGPALKNTTTTALLPLVAPAHLTAPGQLTVYHPNPKEILSFDVHSGTLRNRLRVPALTNTAFRHGHPSLSNQASRNVNIRTTSLAWRTHHVEMYSAHGDGTIHCWKPHTAEDIALEKEEQEEREGAAGTDAAERKRKREEFEQIVQDLSRRKITFT